MRARENARPSFARRALACLVSAAMCVAFTPAVAWGEGAASGELDVSQGGITITATGYTIGGGSETAYTGAYTITGTGAKLVTVSKYGKVLAKKGLKKGRSYTATVKVSCGKATKTVRVTVHVS